MPELMSQINGQRPIIERSHRIFEEQKLAPSLLFIGPHGVGKRKMAIALAQIYLCEVRQEDSNSACGQCSSCIQVANEQHSALMIIEPENHQIKIDRAREAIQFFNFKVLGNKRFIIINEAETMNTQAANALLKVLEEPPPDSHFILISSFPSRLLSTIRSRCQVWPFLDLDRDPIAELGEYAEVFEVRGQVLHLFRRGLTGLSTANLDELREVVRDREKFAIFLTLSMQVIRDLSVKKQGGSSIIHHEKNKELNELCEMYSMDDLVEVFGLLQDLEQSPKKNLDLGLAVEALAAKLKSIHKG